MKKLIVIRHGKSMPLEAGQHDMDRPLHTDGILNSSKIGKYLYDLEVIPNIIITSPARRAITTATLISEQFGFESGKIHSNEELFESSVRVMLKIVNQLKEEWACVYIVAHNPAASYFSEYVSGAEIGDMATCGIVMINFKSKWQEISEGTGEFISYIYPEILKF